MTTDPITTPPDLQRTIEHEITATVRDAAKYDNVDAIPENAVPAVRLIADRAYQRGYRDGMLAEVAQQDGRRDRAAIRNEASA